MTTLFWEAAPDAKATVFLFLGGGGGFGKFEDGKATGGNLLVLSAPYFFANGFNVAIFGRPSDSQDLDNADRISGARLTDIHKVLEVARRIPLAMPATASIGMVSLAPRVRQVI